MGLSSKQVSSDGQGWSQSLLQAQTLELQKPASVKRPLQQQSSLNQQQQAEPLKCPRCDSTNTKFCYYNNYNKSQPRHFCKACKRHWTKGGTLRNVPIGGGRKSKRLKTSDNAATSTATATASRVSTHVAVQSQQQRQILPFRLGDDQKNLSDVPLYQPLIHPPSNLLESKGMGTNNINVRNPFISSSLGLPQIQIQKYQSLTLPNHASTSSFNPTPSTISNSFQRSASVINYAGEITMEDPTNVINTTSTTATSMPITIASSSAVTQPWQQVASTSSGTNNMTTSYWNWDDIDTFVSTDLNIPWDDSDIKP